jgi:hypothetical protein
MEIRNDGYSIIACLTLAPHNCLTCPISFNKKKKKKKPNITDHRLRHLVLFYPSNLKVKSIILIINARLYYFFLLFYILFVYKSGWHMQKSY